MQVLGQVPTYLNQVRSFPVPPPRRVLRSDPLSLTPAEVTNSEPELGLQVAASLELQAMRFSWPALPSIANVAVESRVLLESRLL